MTITRVALTSIEVLMCLAAVWLATEGQPIAGYFIAFGAVMLAWTEGALGWGNP